MVSLPLARRLKQLGLPWSPQVNDFFAIPDRGLDKRVFVLSDIMTNIEQIRGLPCVTFHGSAEWATDYLVTSEIVWLPRESQMRKLLRAKIFQLTIRAGRARGSSDKIYLRDGPESCICSFDFRGKTLEFESDTAADAYALAYIHLTTTLENIAGEIN